MKKAISILLALVLVFTLFACGKTTENPPTATPPGSGDNTPDPGADPALPPPATPGSTDYIGFFDPDFDYASAPRYRVTYMVGQNSILNEQFSVAIAHWAEKMNVDYGGIWNGGNDNDNFINNIPTLAQSNDGLLVDGDPSSYLRISEVLDEVGIPWMTVMSPARDVTRPDAPLLHPSVGFDYEKHGADETDKLLAYKAAVWPDVSMENVGFITVHISVVPEIAARAAGAKNRWVEITGLAENYIDADCVTVGFSADGAYSLVNSLISTADPDLTHWLIVAVVDDFAVGAASAIDNLGLVDVSCIAAEGGASLEAQWNAGNDSAWRFALLTSQNIYAEPVLGALYAFMSGQATPETLWPAWLDQNDHGGDGHTYARMQLPSFFLERDNYQHYLAWSDVYAGANTYPNYDKTGITRDTYPSREPIPASYNS
ncbi:MAG: hypothetical protein LBT12_02605 [Oscillospiraceae bacterium]|jgi:ABC-type sugar transport system substrate-binding protein/predicted small lipoprotein YifL|nr:hypothetical protein [Oscillospiraceae bacterium]